MATVLPTPPELPAPPLSSDDMFRLTVKQYHRMIEAGILTKDDRCELLNGYIVARPPINPPHAHAVRRLTRLLGGMLSDDWVLSPQLPVTIESADSEPLPDVAVAVGPDDLYTDRHPGPKDSVFVAEVSDTTLVRDRTVKLAIYAAAKIPVYWIVNLKDRRIEVYTDPRGGKKPTYRTRADYAPGQSVPVTVAGKTLGSIPVSELLP
jgi:Uma2 family endonuclease